MKKAIVSLTILLFILEGNVAYSQYTRIRSLGDTVSYSFKQQPKFFFNILSFNSFISDDFVNFYGFRMGVQYNHRIKFGLGLLELSPNAVVSPINVLEDTLNITTNGSLRARYFSVSSEYIYFNRYPWQLSVIPLDLGIGGAHYNYNSTLGKSQQLETPDVTLVFYQPALTAQYSIVKWFGIGVSAGYRVTLFASKDVKEDFNAPWFSVEVRLFIDEIYKSIFPNGIDMLKRFRPKYSDPNHSQQ